MDYIISFSFFKIKDQGASHQQIIDSTPTKGIVSTPFRHETDLARDCPKRVSPNSPCYSVIISYESCKKKLTGDCSTAELLRNIQFFAKLVLITIIKIIIRIGLTIFFNRRCQKYFFAKNSFSPASRRHAPALRLGPTPSPLHRSYSVLRNILLFNEQCSLQNSNILSKKL